MKIQSVEAIVLRAKLSKRFGWSQHWTDTRATTLIRIRTDNGIEGIGECCGPPESAKVIIDDLYTPTIVGRDPFDSDVIWMDLYQDFRQYARRGLAIQALGGVDIALWDIKGKAVGKPVYQLMGGAFRHTVQAYATGMYYTDGPDQPKRLADEAMGYVAQGFAAVKMKVGFGVKEDLLNVRTVRNAIGEDIDLMVDANYAYDARTAIQLGRELEQLNVAWFEEPVTPEDLDGYCEVKAALDIPIAGGEAEFTRFGLRDLITRRAVDIVQPDCCSCGGLSEGKRVAEMAHTHNTQTTPHVWGTNIGRAASLHLTATLPPTPPRLNAAIPPFEYDLTEHPIREAITQESFDVVDGRIDVPDRPGLGVTLNEEAVASFIA